MTDDQVYTLKIIKKVITSYLDENIPNNEIGLNMLVNQYDDLVYKIASKIYTESGYKVKFFMIRDVINSRIEPLQEHIIRIKEEKARKLEAKKLEQEARKLEAERLAEKRRLELEQERRKEEENIKIQDEDKILKYKSNEIEEESYRNQIKYKIKELEKTEGLSYLFSEIKKIISEELEIGLDKITLNSHLKDDLNLDYYESLELIMSIEEHFDIEIPDEILETAKKDKIPQNNTSYGNSFIGGIFGSAWTRDYSDIFSSYDHYIDCTLLEIIKYTYIAIQSDIAL